MYDRIEEELAERPARQATSEEDQWVRDNAAWDDVQPGHEGRA